MFMHNTNNYIDVLPQLVHNYNNSYHSTLKMNPADVKDNDERILKILNEKYNKAKKEEQKFNVGDYVRYIINPVTFQKGSNAKWSKNVHQITDKLTHSYTLDNGIVKKYYDLQFVKNGYYEHLNKPVMEPTITQIKKQNKIKRNLKKEGIELDKILPNKKRERKQTDRLHY